MASDRSLDDAAETIGREIGLDLSYFFDPDEPHFDPLTIAVTVGLLLLNRFLDGVRVAAEDSAADAGKRFTEGLVAEIKKLSATDEAITPSETEATVAALQSVLQTQSETTLHTAVKDNEATLMAFLTQQLGMPGGAARRITTTVTREALIQVGHKEPQAFSP